MLHSDRVGFIAQVGDSRVYRAVFHIVQVGEGPGDGHAGGPVDQRNAIVGDGRSGRQRLRGRNDPDVVDLCFLLLLLVFVDDQAENARDCHGQHNRQYNSFRVHMPPRR